MCETRGHVRLISGQWRPGDGRRGDERDGDHLV
jgi:hypothetical protein